MVFKQLFLLLGRVILFYSSIVLFFMAVVWLSFGLEAMYPFLYTFLLSFVVSLILFGFSSNNSKEIVTFREAIGVTVSAWIIISLFSALPYYFSGSIFNLVDCIFESVSGLTTTGASIIPDKEVITQSILLWRSFTQFIGGGGIIMVSVIVLPGLGLTASRLINSESYTVTGENMMPRIMDIAKRILIIYTLLNVILVILLLAGGMNLFESVTHAFGTIATGGFSPLNSSIGTYSKNGSESALYFEIVIIIFMFLGATPFLLHYGVFHGRISAYFKDAQFKFFSTIFILFILMVTFSLYSNGIYSTFGESLRHGSFAVASLFSTTGYGTEDFSLWPAASRLILIMAMFIGGCTGSAAGGIKAMRTMIALKDCITAVRQTVHPDQIYPMKLGNIAVSLHEKKSIYTFIMIYFLFYLLGVMCVAAGENDLETIISSVIACLSGVGPGTTGLISPLGNYSTLQTSSKISLCFMMLLGRVEILPFVAFFLRRFWTK